MHLQRAGVSSQENNMQNMRIKKQSPKEKNRNFKGEEESEA